MMDYLAQYRQKLRTPEQAVQVVKSGDWVDYTTALGFPMLLDAALAKRRDELEDVKIRGNLMFGSLRTVGGVDPLRGNDPAGHRRDAGRDRLPVGPIRPKRSGNAR